jgi:hypothetical protein
MTTAEGCYRELAIDALRAYGQTNTAMGASRAYLVHDAWVKGERNISRLADLAGVSRDTVYADLAKYDIEVAEDLQQRLARWIEDVDRAGHVRLPSSTCHDFQGDSYRRVWVQQHRPPVTYSTGSSSAQVARAEIELVMSIGDGHGAGSWCRTLYGPDDEVIAYERVPMTHESPRLTGVVARVAECADLDAEGAINEVVKQRAQRAELADLHASYRPQWI